MSLYDAEQEGPSAELGYVGSLLQACSQRYNLKKSIHPGRETRTFFERSSAALVKGVPFLKVY